MHELLTCRFVEIAQRGQVVLPHQNVRVAQRRKVVSAFQLDRLFLWQETTQGSDTKLGFVPISVSYLADLLVHQRSGQHSRNSVVWKCVLAVFGLWAFDI